MSLEPISDLTLKDRVISRLRRAILAGSLPPGAALSERDIAQQLGISRTPVREAFAALEREGLLVLSPHREVRVAEMSPAQLDEACRLRALLEGYAFYLALARDAAGLLAELAKVVEDFGRLTAQSVDAANVEALLEQAWQLDLRFHTTIMERAGDSLLRQIWQTRSAVTWLPATPRRFTALDAAHDFLHSEWRGHAGILQAAQAGPPAEAARQLALHILAPTTFSASDKEALSGLAAGLAQLAGEAAAHQSAQGAKSLPL
jgi:DNA-binding GntR family transcriptional regulator